MTGEAVEVAAMSEDAAARLTERIRLTARNVSDNIEKLRRLVADAKDGNAHLALGYKSWTAYLSDVLGDEPLRLARDTRRDLVRELADQGMSTRAIAPIVGTGKDTVHRDLEGVANATRATEPTADPTTGEVTEPEPRTVTGLDGKEYTVPGQKRPRRRPITEVARDAAWDLERARQKVQRILSDDRFETNREAVLGFLRPAADEAAALALQMRQSAEVGE